MAEITTDEYGNTRWTNGGWSIVHYHGSAKIDINAPGQRCGVSIDIDADDSGIDVYASNENGGWEGPSPQRVTIPWDVIAAVIAIREKK